MGADSTPPPGITILGTGGTHFRVQYASRFCANFMFSTHHDFMPISARFRANFMFSKHHDFAQNCAPAVHIFVLGPESHFRPCQTCPNSDVNKVMDHNRSCSRCHLQPYKRFLQMTCNCGTPLIHISHAQNGYIKSGLLRQSFEFFASLDRVILGKLLKNL